MRSKSRIGSVDGDPPPGGGGVTVSSTVGGIPELDPSATTGEDPSGQITSKKATINTQPITLTKGLLVSDFMIDSYVFRIIRGFMLP